MALRGAVVGAGAPCAEASALDAVRPGLGIIIADLCQMSSLLLSMFLCYPLSDRVKALNNLNVLL